MVRVLGGAVQVMVALSQVRVLVPMAVRAWVWRGVRRVVRAMRRPWAVSWTRRIRLSSLRARGALRCLVVEVGVADVSGGEGVVDEGFDHGGVDADRHVAADSLFGPVPDGSEVEKVLEDPEPRLDAC